MKYILIFCVLLNSTISFAQNSSDLNERRITFSAGRSKHGTGDMRGLIFNTEYVKNLRKKISWIAGVGGSIHDGFISNYFTSPGGNEIDGSIRYTTAGVQATGHIGYSIIKTSDNQFEVRAGALLRYQSSSFYDIASIYYPAGTGLPIPVIVFVHESPQRTFAVGGSSQILYNYSITPKILIGALAGLQTDTNGDTITQLSLSIGRKF